MARLYRKPGTPRWLGFACLVSLFPAITTAGSPETAQNDRALFERLKTVASAEPSAQRQLALITLGGQNLYRAIAQSESDLELAYLATVLLTDQDDLKRQAVSRRALIRLAAVNYVTDESFLLARAMGRDEPSPAVRRAIIAQLRNPSRPRNAPTTRTCAWRPREGSWTRRWPRRSARRRPR